MKIALTAATAIIATLLIVVLFDFRITDSGSLPQVEVSGGDMPNAEVRGPDVAVTTEKKSFSYPSDVEVKTDRASVEVPTDVDFELPEDRESKKELIN